MAPNYATGFSVFAQGKINEYIVKGSQSKIL